MNPESPSSSSLGRNLYRGGAVALALVVLVWFVYDAQQRANERARQAEAMQPAADEGELPAALPSSKVLVIEPQDGFLPSSKFRALPQADGQGAAVLPSTKGIVIDESTFLFGSKSGVIEKDSPVDPARRPRETVIHALPSSKSIIIEPPVTAPPVKKKDKN